MAELPEEVRKVPPADRCKIAVEAALFKAYEFCGPEAKDYFFREIAEMLGINPHDINPLSEHCKRVLEALDNPERLKEVCKDFREIRRLVLCYTWHIIETQGKRFRDAIRQAWREIKDRCAEVGVYV